MKKQYQALEPPVTPEILATKTGLTLNQVENCLEAMRFLKPMDWSDFNSTIHSSWKRTGTSPEYQLERMEMKEILADGIESLPKKERLTLTMYYSEDLTLSEIGEVLGLSESRISRLLSSAKFRLKEFVKKQTN